MTVSVFDSRLRPEQFLQSHLDCADRVPGLEWPGKSKLELEVDQRSIGRGQGN